LAVGGALIAAGLAADGSTALTLAGAGAMALFVGVVVVSPVAGRPVIRALSWPFARFGGNPGRMGGRNALRDPRQTAATASALTIGLALIATVSVVVQSMASSVDRQLDAGLTADYQVTGRSQITPVAAEAARAVAGADGVRSAIPIRTARFELDGSVRTAAAGEPGELLGHFRLPLQQGTPSVRGDALLVGRGVAAAQGWTVGTTIDGRYQDGTRRTFRIAGIYADRPSVTPSAPSMIIDWASYRKRDPGAPIDRIEVNVTPAGAGAGRAALEAALAGVVPYIFTPPHEGGPRRAGVVLLGDSPERQLGPAVRRLSERRGLRRWALVGNDYIWPRSVHRVAGRLVRSLGAEVVLDRLVPFPLASGDDPEAGFEELVDALERARAQAILLSLVGRDLAVFNRVFAAARPASGVVRLSGALEENVLLAAGGDDTGELYSAMRSFAGQGDDRRIALAERYRAAFGAAAPVLDTYAEGCYDGVHLAAALAAAGLLTARDGRSGAVRLLGGDDRAARLAWSAAPLGPPPAATYLARADGLDLAVIARL
ncbi:ABC transporter substrate-binding protein, partial [Actinomadura geliboluensis]